MPRILLVEDEPLQRESYAEILRRTGHDVVSTVNAETALDVLTQDQAFDLILSDYWMGELNGLQLLSAIKYDSRMQNIKFMLQTSEGDRKVREACEAAGGKFRYKMDGIRLEQECLPSEVRTFLQST